MLLIKMLSKVYSSAVEHAAHNGTDVGSNPAKPTTKFINDGI